MLDRDRDMLLAKWRAYVKEAANTDQVVMGFGEWVQEIYFNRHLRSK